MTTIELIDNSVEGTAIAKQVAELPLFLGRQCAALVWQRAALENFQKWMDQLDIEQCPEGRLILRVEAVADAVDQLCDMAGTPQSPEREMLVNDIATLSELFADLMDTQFLRLRLERVTDNACRKFHRDTLTGRLVCTYRGPGTQFGQAHDGQDPEYIVDVPTFSPILLRGNKWPETPDSGLVHRSPPIEVTGQERFVLVLDPIDDPDNAF